MCFELVGKVSLYDSARPCPSMAFAAPLLVPRGRANLKDKLETELSDASLSDGRVNLLNAAAKLRSVAFLRMQINPSSDQGARLFL